MKYIAIAETDVGIAKDTNQDRILIKHADSQVGELVLAVICDGMGGLAKGELASATVIREFSRWFDEELPFELTNLDFQIIQAKWTLMIKDLNALILDYGHTNGVSLGTTFTGMLIINDQYLIGHVGDTRAYYISSLVKQLTLDQTFVAREIQRGTLTLEQAKMDKRRNMLLQCVGASEQVEPSMMIGKCEKGVYMLCSDGFRHEISEEEIYEKFNSTKLKDANTMHMNARYLIEKNKERQEKDNISVVLIKSC